jgi:hypothetical protein
MPRHRNKKGNVESITLGELLTALNLKQVFVILSAILSASLPVVGFVISTAYSYGYTSAQTKASSEMTIHLIEDKMKQVEDTHIHHDKDIKIEKITMENEILKDGLDCQPATQSSKQPALLIKVPKH